MAPRLVEPKTLIDELLAQQQSVTAVTRFAGLHEQDALPAQAQYYRDLIPRGAPGDGQQYAFEVDLDLCSGCKACVTACHSLNGLDQDEVWRSVGLLHGDSVQKHVTTACHHCIDPGCLNGCPVLAYEKDPVTGIVKHLDDQCIGCSYCILKCPYDVPKYSAERGIVRKCDMCSSRLASGEAPACVQACPNEAIRITTIDREEVSREFATATSSAFLPDAPAPDYTKPSTKYLSSDRALPGLSRADKGNVEPSKGHLPLVFFLVLTQMSVGGFLLAGFFSHASPTTYTVSLAAGLSGLLASVFHLGKPLKAWRAFLGLRQSWLSREIIAFGLYAPFSVIVTGSIWLSGVFDLRVVQLLTVSLSLIGMVCVYSSVMVYHDTHRKFWNWPRTTFKFFGTTLLLGSAIALPEAKFLLMATAVAKLVYEWSESMAASPEELARTGTLLRGPLRRLFTARLLLLLLGGVILPFASIPAAAIPIVLIASELIERHLFFRAVSPDRMPGLPS